MPISPAKTCIDSYAGIASHAVVRERFVAPPGKPYLLGVSRDAHGKLAGVYSDSPEFKSVRELGNSNDWNPDRKLEIIPLEVQIHPGFELHPSPDFKLLPQDLQDLFKSGRVLVTRPRQRGRDNPSEGYAVGMASAVSDFGASRGRTGFLIKDGKPLAIELNGRDYNPEFNVELKHVGLPDGGFKYGQEAFPNRIKGGGTEAEVLREHGNLEFDRIHSSRFQAGDTPRSAGFITFDSPAGRQGYLIRLSPGTIRASFTGSRDLPISKEAHQATVKGMSELWAEFIAQGRIPYSHPENVIANLDRTRFYPTDYSDILDLRSFPRVLENQEIDPMSSLILGLDAIEQLPGYRKAEDFPVAMNAILNRIQAIRSIPAPVVRELRRARSMKELAEMLWRNWASVEYFREVREHGQVPPILSKLDFKSDEVKMRDLSGFVASHLKARNVRLSEQLAELRRDVQQFESDLRVLAHDRKELTQHLQALNRKPEKSRSMRDFEEIKMVEGELSTLGIQEKRMRQMMERRKDELQVGTQSLEAIRRTGYTLEGAIRELSSASLQSVKNELGSAFGAVQKNLSDLSNYMWDQVGFLEMVQDALPPERAHEIAPDLVEATRRLNELEKMDPFTYHQKILQDPSYIQRMATLPFQKGNAPKPR